MYLLMKLKEQGVLWFMRRIIREFVKPTTRLGKYIQPWSWCIYYLVSKPINFLFNIRKNPQNSLYFFYDFEVNPITYDFVWALCIANAKREALGLSHLCVIFVPAFGEGVRKESAIYEQVVNCDARAWRVYAILISAIKLLTTPVSMILCATRKEALLIRAHQAHFVYPEKYNVIFPVPYSPEEAIVYQQAFKALRADKQALKYVADWLESKQIKSKKLIVITLRQYGYKSERNSNMNAWIQFVQMLDRVEFSIVFIPDMEQSFSIELDELNQVYLFDPACWDLKLRAALYESAYLNLGVNTGPMALCWLNARCRYITFKTVVKSGPQFEIDVLVERGFVPDKNPFFTTQFQKWVWEEDDFDILNREFWLMYDDIEKNRNASKKSENSEVKQGGLLSCYE